MVAFRVIKGLSDISDSPETVMLKAPNVPGMIQFIRSVGPDRWPLPAPPSDLDFSQLDSAYVTLGERGHPHFRPRLSAPTEDLAVERNVYRTGCNDRWRRKPRNHAFAWYADLHAGALAYAGRAADALEPKRRDFLQGLAVVLELSALHYLEDSVSAGHMVPDEGLNSGSLMATHNTYCAAGVPARPSSELCRLVGANGFGWQVELPALTKACNAPGGPAAVRLYGDHQLSNKKRTTESVTRDWAAAVVAESMLEVIRATEVKNGIAIGSALDLCDVADEMQSFDTNHDVYTWTPERHACASKSDQQLYQCLYRWWERDEPGGRLDHALFISALFQGPHFAAARMLPVPLVDDIEVSGSARTDATDTVRTRASSIYPQQIFLSGLHFDLAALGGLAAGTATYGLLAGGRFIVPRTIAGLQVSLGARLLATGSEPRWSSIDGVLGARLLLGERNPFVYVNGVVGVARTGDASGWRSGVVGGLGVLASYDKHEFSLAAEAGWEGLTRGTCRLAVGVSF